MDAEKRAQAKRINACQRDIKKSLSKVLDSYTGDVICVALTRGLIAVLSGTGMTKAQIANQFVDIATQIRHSD